MDPLVSGAIAVAAALVGMGTARRRANASADPAPFSIDAIMRAAAAVEPRPSGAGGEDDAHGRQRSFAGWFPPVAMLFTCAIFVYQTLKHVDALQPDPVYKPWCTPTKSLIGAYGSMGDWRGMNVSGADTTSQELFRQGILHAWGFNQGEAQRNFRAAIEQSPGCAMCQWGLAYALGPSVNKVAGVVNDNYPVFSAADHGAARNATLKALELCNVGGAGAAPQWEINYAYALLKRYPEEWEPAQHAQHERAYALAMRGIMEGDVDEVDDVNAHALYAEALMNNRAWDYYLPSGRKGLQSCDGPRRPSSQF